MISADRKIKYTLLLIAGLIYCSVAFSLQKMVINGDAGDYLRDAQLLLATGQTEAPAFYYPPGTTYWLAFLLQLFGNSRFVCIFSGLLLCLAAVWLVTSLTQRLTQSHIASCVGGLLVACYLPMLLLAGQPYPQVLSLVCLGMTILCWSYALGARERGGDGVWEDGRMGVEGEGRRAEAREQKSEVRSQKSGARELQLEAAACQSGRGEELQRAEGGGRRSEIRPTERQSGCNELTTDNQQPTCVLACLPPTTDKNITARRFVAFALAGGSLGYGALTKPASLSIGLAMALTGLYVFRRYAKGNRPEKIRLASGAFICLLMAGLTVAPTLAHNYRGGGGLMLSINNERNFWLGNNPHTPYYKTSHLAQRSLNELPEDTQAYLLQHYIRNETADSALRVRLSRTLRKKRMQSAWDHIKDRPGLFLLRTVNRCRAFWGFDYLGSRQIQEWRGWSLKQAAPLYVLEAGSYCGVMVLALIGLFGRGRGSAGVTGYGGMGVEERKRGREEPQSHRATELQKNGDQESEGRGQICRAAELQLTKNQEPKIDDKRQFFSRFHVWALVAFVLAYQLPYCFAFSAGTYHFPVMVLIFPLAALGIIHLHKQGIRKTLFQWRVTISLVIFALIQIEYAYFTLKWI